MAEKKVSVIIPVYNVEKYLGECLESVINQTLTEIEIICVDDGSTDNSLDILYKYAIKDARVKNVMLRANYGLSYARNRGMEVAEGKYIYFLDSDDYIKEETLEELYELAEKDNTDIIVFGSTIIFENDSLRLFDKNTRVNFQNNYPAIMTGEQTLINWMKNQDMTTLQQRYFYRTDFLKKNNLKFIEGIIHEDAVFFVDVLLKAQFVRCINNAYFVRRLRENSIVTSRFEDKHLEGTLYSLYNTIYHLNSITDNKELKKALENLAWQRYQIVMQYYIQSENHIYENGFHSKYKQLEYMLKMIQINNVGGAGLIYTQGMECYERLKKLDTVYIYGAGMFAKRALSYIENMEIVVKGFIVQKCSDNPKAVCGIPVIETEDADKNIPVIIGVSAKFFNQVKDKLYQEQFKECIIFEY